MATTNKPVRPFGPAESEDLVNRVMPTIPQSAMSTSAPPKPASDPSTAPANDSPERRTAKTFLARGPRPETGSLRSENLVAIFMLATRLHEDGHLGQAAELYTQVMEADASFVEARHLYGLLLAQRGDHAGAAVQLESVVRDQPTNEHLRELGEVYCALERWDRAVRQFSMALEANPADMDAMRNLGHARYAQDRFADAARAYRHALQARSTDPRTWAALGFSLAHLGHINEARSAFGVAIEQDPSDDESRHMHSALAGEVPRAAPESYVAALFDRYATRFERHLVEGLGYRVPEQLRALVDEVQVSISRPHSLDILDLGCGTGLTGAAFADCAARCVGVDVSTEMIELCRNREPYTEVEAMGIRPWLRAAIERGEQFDLILAGDVLIYVGDVDDVFPMIHALLRPGGLFGFSTECAPGHDYQLQTTGRFAHSLPYLDRTTALAQFELEGRRPTIIRVERDHPVTGHLSVVRRPA